MRIEVTDYDIKSRLQYLQDGLYDPLATAIRRTTGKVVFVSWDWFCFLPETAEACNEALYEELRHARRLPLPDEAKRFVRLCDLGQHWNLEPAVFDLPFDADETDFTAATCRQTFFEM